MLAVIFILFTLAVAISFFWRASEVAVVAFANNTTRKKFINRAGLIMLIWLVYITLLSMKGVFVSQSLPPRIPVLLVLPAFAFIGFFFLSGKFKKLIDATPASWPVRFQVFRVGVELLLAAAFVQHKLPVEATFEGYNFDILIGIAAPILGWLAFKNERQSKIAVILFNIAGLITLSVVVFILTSQAYFPSVWHKQESILGQGFGTFPFTYLAGFLMPVAVFMHIFSFVRIAGK